MTAYKLFRLRRDGTLGSLFINRRAVLPVGVWMQSEFHHTAKFKERMGWHCLTKPNAPHLSKRGRVWAKVWIHNYESITRPECQGGKWYLAHAIKIAEVMR